MTYNVNYGIAGDASTIEVIRAGQADIVLLQESNADWEVSLKHELGARYAHMEFRDDQAAGGLAVLSRWPFALLDEIPSPAGWFPAWRIRVATPAGPLQILSVHLHPPVTEEGSWVVGFFSTGRVRRTEISSYYERLDPHLATAIVGDFNESEDGRAVGFLLRQGFSRALPTFDGGAYTWRWPTRLGELHMRLDHILFDARLRPLECRVLHGGQSDHLAVTATFIPATRH